MSVHSGENSLLRAWQEEAASFVDQHLAPYANQFDQTEQIPGEFIGQLAQKGFLSAMLPAEYGGRNFDMITLGILAEEIGRGCSSVRSLLTVHGMVIQAIYKWGTRDQKTRWLPSLAAGESIGAFALSEEQAGSDVQGLQTVAVETEDAYWITGVKKWTTFGQIADVFLVFALLDGQPSAFLIPRESPGVRVKKLTGILGTRASMLAEIHFDRCRISKDALIGKKGFGLSHVATSCLDYGRYTIAWGCVGIAEACLRDSLKYTSSRKQFGVYLREQQLIQKMITEMVSGVKAARLLCMRAGELKDAGHPEAMMETWVAKYFASTTATKTANQAVQIHGANGCSPDYAVQRYLRDSKVMEIIEGSTQMHEILIATHAYTTLD
ncbi:acyl-CoA dehydrogenase [Brevibacillus panacihumi W25]|uniref:Acyl-CoA dehydrogenase n=1 Tax=Brevibacillus panacihumi W25 TaxID=1408254 RepID=V6MD11_9BACL|nr:acyl-CoA dehydrogenase family protein [Brevibacillus panacihumi]EST55795.1 acyl-CoA dehydrogenase [Brevibacillus panacihumi W25]